MTEPVPRPEFRANKPGLQEYYRIDVEEGFYIEPVLLREGELLPPDVVTEEFPSTLGLPRWDGTEWVEGLSDYELADRLKAEAVQRAKTRAEEDMAAQYPESANWVVDFTLDYAAGKRPEGQNQDRRMRAINIIRSKRDRFVERTKDKTDPREIRNMRWDDEGTW